MIPLWYDIALREIGVAEVSGAGANPRIVEYLSATPLAHGGKSDETPWCASFVNWCLVQAQVKGTRSAAARSFLKWGAPRDPRPGAIVVIRHLVGSTPITASGFHVGFYVSGSKTSIRLLGGNQGNAVKESEFPLTKWNVLAVRWPVGEQHG